MVSLTKLLDDINYELNCLRRGVTLRKTISNCKIPTSFSLCIKYIIHPFAHPPFLSGSEPNDSLPSWLSPPSWHFIIACLYSYELAKIVHKKNNIAKQCIPFNGLFSSSNFFFFKLNYFPSSLLRFLYCGLQIIFFFFEVHDLGYLRKC